MVSGQSLVTSAAVAVGTGKSPRPGCSHYIATPWLTPSRAVTGAHRRASADWPRWLSELARPLADRHKLQPLQLENRADIAMKSEAVHGHARQDLGDGIPRDKCWAVSSTMPCMVARNKEETRGALLSQMRRGALEYCVLALLRSGERYGFDLVRSLGEADGLVTSEGTIYPLLGRLRRDGLVETTWRESTAGPPRRYYRLTRAGLRSLDIFAVEWRRFRDAVDRLLEDAG